jgi:hypothetical protein
MSLVDFMPLLSGCATRADRTLAKALICLAFGAVAFLTAGTARCPAGRIQASAGIRQHDCNGCDQR